MTSVCQPGGLRFDNTFARLPASLHARAAATPLAGRLQLVSFNRDVAALIDLDAEAARDPALVRCFGGGPTLPGAEPVAMRYAGHRFGSFEPELGDGRALLLGEVLSARGQRWELHLKGCGPTPFSRGMDGRAVLRAVLREYLGSEAMHGLGIPTTRSLCVVVGEEQVTRETVESAAMLLRIAPTHIRFGSFEWLHSRGDRGDLARLADYVIGHHYPHLAALPDRAERVEQLFAAVVDRSARLVAAWQAAGWIHGGLNTDNMSILGLTLDYDGPYHFFGAYDPTRVCCRSDRQSRFAFARQPAAVSWNLERLAEALAPLCRPNHLAAALAAFMPAYESCWLARMRRKLGLCAAQPRDAALVADLLALAAAERLDYPSLFRALGELRRDDDESAPLRAISESVEFAAWVRAYRLRLRQEDSRDEQRSAAMRATNPRYVLRDHILHTAIDAAERLREFSEIEQLLPLLRDPFTERPGMERYAGPGSDEVVVSSSS